VQPTWWEDDDLAVILLVMGYTQVCDTVSRFLVDSVASVLRVRNFSAFELQQIAQKFEMLVASGQTNGNDCLSDLLGFRKFACKTHHC
jgi:hypothetical protein